MVWVGSAFALAGSISPCARAGRRRAAEPAAQRRRLPSVFCARRRPTGTSGRCTSSSEAYATWAQRLRAGLHDFLRGTAPLPHRSAVVGRSPLGGDHARPRHAAAALAGLRPALQATAALPGTPCCWRCSASPPRSLRRCVCCLPDAPPFRCRRQSGDAHGRQCRPRHGPGPAPAGSRPCAPAKRRTRRRPGRRGRAPCTTSIWRCR